MKNILVIGATSAMASEVAKKYAQDNNRLFLVARDAHKLRSVENDLRSRGADKIESFVLDINDVSQHEQMLTSAYDCLGKLDIVLIAHGTLPDQRQCEQDVTTMLSEFNTNAISTIALLTGISNRLETQKAGVIAVITSVAGDRGRPSNYVYGSAKAAVSTFLEGLNARMFKSGVFVLDIRPGFVATPMTKNLNLPEKLTATPEAVASDIIRAIDRKKQVLYTPFFWKYILIIIRNIPRRIFRKLSL